MQQRHKNLISIADKVDGEGTVKEDCPFPGCSFNGILVKSPKINRKQPEHGVGG